MNRWFRKKQPPPWASVLHRHEVDQLATYNAERARGIVHTDRWKAEMAEVQRRFNWAMKARP